MSIIVIGLTGQSGAGKTTVCRQFSDSGFAVINADKVARKVMEKGSPCLEETCEVFGNVKDADGNLDRKKIASIVFTDREKKKIYEGIIFPYITEEIVREIKGFDESGEEYVVLDAPTLFESGTDKLCTVIVSVICDRETRLERILARDGITRQQAEARLNSQYDDKFYTEKSDYVIVNDSTEEEFLEKAVAVIKMIKGER